jgi:5'(3')-deoxyribonucleotidase
VEDEYSKIVYLDVDSVLLELHPGFLATLNKELGTRYTMDNITTFGYVGSLSPEHAKIVQAMWSNPSLYDGKEADPAALAALAKIRKFARAIALSSPTIGHVDSKLRWLTKHCGFLKEDIIIAKDKSLQRGAVLIDDHIENLLRFPGGRICFSRPWNTAWDTKLGPRTDDWNEIIKITKKIIAGSGIKL